MPLTIIATVTTGAKSTGPFMTGSTRYEVNAVSDDATSDQQVHHQMSFWGAFPDSDNLAARIDRGLRHVLNLKGSCHGWRLVYSSPYNLTRVFELDYDGWKS